MIRVTVELIPGGVGAPQLLATAIIANDGSGTRTRGSYWATFGLKRKDNWRNASISDFPRTRLYAWDLLYRLLRDAVGDRNK